MIKVLVVDDSAVVRRAIGDELERHHDIRVVGTAEDPYVARDKIVELSPDVLTLDVEMPRMDGLSFLAKLMKYQPMPVVIVSSLTQPNSDLAIRALQLGAVEVVPKPGSVYTTPDNANLVRAVRAAAGARVARTVEDGPPTAYNGGPLRTTKAIVAMGASTGGVRAIETVLKGLPAECPGIVIVQHMPSTFTGRFAAHLQRNCPMDVREARDGDDVVAGLALVAPAGKHTLLLRSGEHYAVRVKEGPRVHYQRPSVDVLFNSVAAAAGANGVGVLLTGMGVDGAAGMLAMREAGAHTIAEAKSTCIVYGMPRAADEMGAVAEVTPLGKVAGSILNAISRVAR